MIINKYYFIDNILAESREKNPSLNFNKIKRIYLKEKNSLNSWYIIKGLIYGIDLTDYIYKYKICNENQIDTIINNIQKRHKVVSWCK